MKYLVVILAALLTGCAQMDAFGYKHEEALRVAYHAMNLADAGTTMARDPACMSEANPFLGSNPSNSSVALFALAQSLIYEGIHWYVKENEPEEMPAFQWSFLIVKTLTVGWNAGQLAKGCP